MVRLPPSGPTGGHGQVTTKWTNHVANKLGLPGCPYMDDTGHPMNNNSDESCEGAGTTYQKENHKNKWKVTGERSECKTEIYIK